MTEILHLFKVNIPKVNIDRFRIPDTNFTENAADEDDTAMPLLSKYRLLMYAMLWPALIGPD
jgi:hypothetical protein